MRNARSLALVLPLLLLAAPVRAGAEGLEVPAGSSRSGDLVALGQPVSVHGEVTGSVVLVGGRASLDGRIRGNLVLLGADSTVRESGRVDGDLLAVGGRVTWEGGASAASAVGGRVHSVEALEAAYLTELRTSPLEASAVSPLLLSFRLFVLLGWLLIGLVLLRLAPRRVSGSARAASGRLGFLAVLGAAAVLTGALLSAFVLTVLPAGLALAAVGTVLGVLLVAKAAGLAALFLLVGRRLSPGARRGSLFFGDPAALALGLLALGLVSLAPVVGVAVWSVASLAAIGLALQALLGPGALLSGVPGASGAPSRAA